MTTGPTVALTAAPTISGPTSTKSESPKGIQSFPEDVLLKILSNLEATDAVEKRLVCKDWNAISKNDDLWNFFLSRDFGLAEGGENPYELYKGLFLSKSGSAKEGTLTSKSAPQGSPATAHSIPVELKRMAFSYLGVKELGLLSSVCKEGNRLLAENSLWSRFLKEDFAVSCETENSKALYQQLHHCQTNLSKGYYTSKKIRPSQTSRKKDNSYTKSPRRDFPFSAVLSEDGKLISIDGNRQIMVWNLKTGKCEKTIDCQDAQFGPDSDIIKARQSALLPNGRDLVVRYEDGTIFIWNLENGDRSDLPPKALDGNGRVLTGDGKLISSSESGVIAIWNLESGMREQILECNNKLEDGHDGVFIGTRTEDGKLILGFKDGTIGVWDLATGKCERMVERIAVSATSLALTKEGNIVIGSQCGKIRILHLEGGLHETTLGYHACQSYAMPYTAVRFLVPTKNGKLISVCEGNQIKIWNLNNEGALEQTLEEHGWSEPVFVSSLGKLVFADDADIKILDFTATSREVLEELAGIFASGPDYNRSAITRFKRIPREERNKIYGELYQLLRPLKHDYWGCAEDAFFDRNGMSAKPEHRAQAIRNYLNKKLSG